MEVEIILDFLLLIVCSYEYYIELVFVKCFQVINKELLMVGNGVVIDEILEMVIKVIFGEFVLFLKYR